MKCEWHTNNYSLYPQKKPDYTIEQLDMIYNGSHFKFKRDKNKEFSAICKRNKLKCGGNCKERYERLREHLEKFNEG